MPRVVERAHRRLHQAAGSVGRPVVAPRLQRSVRGQDEVRPRRRLVRVRRRRHDERHGVESRTEIGRPRQRVHRVHLVEEQHVNLAPPHCVRQVDHVLVRRRGVPHRRGREAHRRADVARHAVEQRDGDLRLGRAGAPRGGPAADGEGPAGSEVRVREGPSQLGDARRGHAAPGGGRFGAPGFDEPADLLYLARREQVALHPPLGHDGPYHRGRHRSLGAGLEGDPLVRARRGERQARLEVHEARGAAVAGTPRFREVAGVAHRGEPGLQEVRSERDHEVGPAEVVLRQAVAPEDRPAGGPQRLVGERLVPQPAGAAHGGGPAVDERIQGAGQDRGHDGDAVTPSGRPQIGEAVGERALAPLPVDRVEHRPSGGRVRGAASVRAAVAVRAVESLERRLAAHAEGAAVRRMRRIALDLYRPAFASLDEGAATARALAADAGVPGRDARNDVLGRHDVRNDPFGRGGGAGADGGGRPGPAEHPQERAAPDGLGQSGLPARGGRFLHCSFSARPLA